MYTDDSVCTAAVADIVLNDRKPDSTLQDWCRRHPGRGYGGFFRKWIASDEPLPYGSFGNGAAMRVAPVALLYRQRPLEEALAASDRVTEITHDHPEGIKGARAVTEAIWLALRGEEPDAVRRAITKHYAYDLERSLEALRPSHRFDVTCQGAVRTALICALESTSLEDAVRNPVSLGGDADTLAAIAGAVGEALHGLPEGLVQIARDSYLGEAQDITATLDALCRLFLSLQLEQVSQPIQRPIVVLMVSGDFSGVFQDCHGFCRVPLPTFFSLFLHAYRQGEVTEREVRVYLCCFMEDLDPFLVTAQGRVRLSVALFVGVCVFQVWQH